MMRKLCDTLLNTESVMDALGQGEYLRHPREIAALEDLLPHNEKVELATRRGHLSGNRYEYVAKMGTKKNTDLIDGESEKMYCKRCRKKHKAGDCPKSGDGCYECGDKGHFARDCPKVARDKKETRGRGENHGINSNVLRPVNCRRCPHAGKSGKACPACKKSGNDLKHCLMHCSSYNVMGVREKVETLKQAQGCSVC